MRWGMKRKERRRGVVTEYKNYKPGGEEGRKEGKDGGRKEGRKEDTPNVFKRNPASMLD